MNVLGENVWLVIQEFIHHYRVGGAVARKLLAKDCTQPKSKEISDEASRNPSEVKDMELH